MLRSRKIQDYFQVKLEQIRADVPLPADIHLFFARNSHLLLWRARGDHPSRELIERSLSRGITKVWIHSADLALWEAYLSPPAAPAAPAAQPPAATPSVPASEEPKKSSPEEERKPAAAPTSPEPERPPARTEEGAVMAEAITSKAITPEQKEALLTESARSMLQQAAAAQTVEEQREADRKNWQTIQDVLDAIADQTGDAVAETWKMAKIDPDLEHAVNVATYSVIFAMAFGKIESDLVSDLALAGLLHDLGISQLRASLANVPLREMTPAQRAEYSQHVALGLEIIEAQSPEVTARVKTVIEQHHEKFDGSGYPRSLKGFQVDDVSQLVAMAELLHVMSSGHWDGKERTLKESFETLERLEKARSFPEFFNPDVYSSVIRWIRNDVSGEMGGKASAVVTSRVQEMMGQKRA